jgi:hypothetical protein
MIDFMQQENDAMQDASLPFRCAQVGWMGCGLLFRHKGLTVIDSRVAKTVI